MWLVLGLAVVMAFAFQGTRGLYESTEGRYAEAGREMLETGNWWVPQLGYEPHLTKPPMTYWAIAAGMAVLGRNEWGVRLYLAVAFVVATWGVHRIARVLWGRRTALVAGCLYACAPGPVLGMCCTSTDQLLTMFGVWMVAAYCELWRGGGAAGRWRMAMWVCCGLGFLTKGPPVLLLLAALAGHGVYLRRKQLPAVRMFAGAGPWIGLVVGLSWFVILLWWNPSLWKLFLGEEVYGRIFTGQQHRNARWYKPLLIYLPMLLGGLGPLILIWLPVIRRVIGGRGSMAGVPRPKVALLVLWTILPLTILSVSESRLPLYVLPVLPAMVLATARALVVWFDGPRAAAWFRGYIVAMTTVVLTLKGIAGYADIPADSRRLHRELRALAPADAVCVLFECESLHGLDFYQNGRVERIREPAGGSDAAAAAELRQLLAKHAGARDFVLVTGGKHTAKSLRKVLEQERLSVVATKERGDYSLFRVTLPGS